jgi:hypothetical protein
MSACLPRPVPCGRDPTKPHIALGRRASLFVSAGVVAHTRRSCRQTLDSCYPIRKVTRPVPVEGGLAGGALPMSAGTSAVRRRTRPGGRSWRLRPVIPSWHEYTEQVLIVGSARSGHLILLMIGCARAALSEGGAVIF